MHCTKMLIHPEERQQHRSVKTFEFVNFLITFGSKIQNFTLSYIYICQHYNRKRQFKLLPKTTIRCAQMPATNGVEESRFLAR